MSLFPVSDAPWTVLLANIEPESTGVTVGGLIPARSYQFRLCAVNDVGRGQFSKETDRFVPHALGERRRDSVNLMCSGWVSAVLERTLLHPRGLESLIKKKSDYFPVLAPVGVTEG